MQAFNLTAGILKELNSHVFSDLKNLENYRKDVWFWREVSKRKLLKFLDFASDPLIAETAENLLYAYTCPGTMEAFIRLAKGLFGAGAKINLKEPAPAVIEITVKNANINFLHSLAQQATLAFNESLALATSDLADAVSFDPYQFFRNFLTPGRVLKKLNIGESDAN